MKTIKSVLPKAGMIFLIFTLLCGVIYTGVGTGIAQLIFSDNANGSIIEVDGKKYGCELLGQQYTDEAHMWGRIMNIDVSTYTDENGKALMYAAPSNLSPASEEYAQLVAERVEKLRNANPEMDETAVPVDLVTCSGSGLDPHISPAAAEYQVARIAKANDMTDDEVRNIIRKCTEGRFLGIFGEETVNVLEVNLMLDGILRGEMNIAKIMIPKISTVFLHEKDTIRQGLERFMVHGYTAVPVLNDQEQYIGSVTEGDFLRHLLVCQTTDLKVQEGYRLGSMFAEIFALRYK